MHRVQLGIKIRILSKYLSRYLNKIDNVDKSVSGPQALILGYICDSEEDVFQRDIEKYFNIRRSTATGLINGLEKNGYVTRESVPYDARLKKLVTTQKAQDEFSKVEEKIYELEDIMLKGLTEEEINIFENIICKMINNLLEDEK